MLWPTHIPKLTPSLLSSWAHLSYPRLCAAFLKLFVAPTDPDLTHADIDAICASAFGSFGSDAVVPIVPLVHGTHLAELWHGRTLAFKDLGMSVLGRVLDHLLTRRREQLTLLVGTSGDTGSSAIEAVRGLGAVRVVVLYPLSGWSSITRVQERQMTSVAECEANVHVVGVEGTSDELDVPIEACFRDRSCADRHRLGSVNSVNVVRLLVQAVHFVYAHLQTCEDDMGEGAEAPTQFAVPCGAGGHLSGGLLALQMGLRAQLIACTNANDAMHRVLSTGSMTSGAPTKQTTSPSMDIQMPYNVWRILFVASGGDGGAVRAWQQRMEASGTLQVPQAVRKWIAERIRTVSVSDDETLQTLREVHAACGHVLDPHTAVGVAGMLRSPFGLHGTRVCLGCAHAVKFLPAIARALRCDLRAALDALPELARGHAGVVAVGEMARRLLLSEPTEDELRSPPGCTAIFRRGQDWEAGLRRLLDKVAPIGAARSKL